VVHENASGLTPRGWKALGNGDAAFLATCHCGAAHQTAVAREGTVCARCRRLITGRNPDLKVCVAGPKRLYMLCVPCHRRQHEAVVLRPRRELPSSPALDESQGEETLD
jgi:hypothetical protein